MTRLKIIALAIVALVALGSFGVIVSGVLPYRVYIVHTGSMSPTIPSRSAVIVRVGDYRVGSPVSFLEQGGIVTHRLVSIDAAGTVTTKGDANTTADPWTLKRSAIIGGVIASPPEVGYWLMYLKNPFGLASILLSVLVCWQLWSLARMSPAGATSTAEQRVRERPFGRATASHRRRRRALRVSGSPRESSIGHIQRVSAP